MNSSSTFLVIDLEATCWQKGTSTQPNETIEIGCAVVRAKEIIFSSSWFIKPLINPQLSDFCLKLISIKQEQVDAAPLFPIALANFKTQIEEVCGQALETLPFISWGNYDRRQFMSDCTLHNIIYPFGPHTNLKKDFLRLHRLKVGSLSKALEIHELIPQGTLHRGVDDAINTARVFIKAFDGEISVK